MKLLRIAPMAILACALALTACANTIRGVGKDVNRRQGRSKTLSPTDSVSSIIWEQKSRAARRGFFDPS